MNRRGQPLVVSQINRCPKVSSLSSPGISAAERIAAFDPSDPPLCDDFFGVAPALCAPFCPRFGGIFHGVSPVIVVRLLLASSL
jgi:hypothetical protein